MVYGQCCEILVDNPPAPTRATVEYSDIGICYCETALDAAADADAVVLVTEWRPYRDLPWGEIKGRMRQPLILDGQNFLPSTKLAALGFECLGIGR